MSALGPDFLQLQTFVANLQGQKHASSQQSLRSIAMTYFAGTTSRQQAPERRLSAMFRAQAIEISVVHLEPPVVGDLLVEAFTLQ